MVYRATDWLLAALGVHRYACAHDQVVSAKTMSRHRPKPDRRVSRWLRGLALSWLFGLTSANPAGADSVADFFAGKTLSLIAGFPPGGGYDSYIRVLAR